MQNAKVRSKYTAWVVGVAILILAFLLRGIIIQLLTQVAIGYLLMALALPLAKRLERSLSKGLAATIALTVLSGGLILALFLLVPLILRQGKELAQVLPFLIEKGQALWDSASAFLVEKGIALFKSEDLNLKLSAWVDQVFPMVVKQAGSLAGSLSLFFPAPILAFYFLKDREAIACRLSMWVPLSHRQQAVAAAREMKREISGFFRGQLLVSLAVGGLTALGLLVVGVPAWLLLGVLMGVLELIPYLGPILGAIPVVLFALPAGLGKVLWALGVVVAVQQLEGSVISPKLMSGATDLHPVVVLLAISVGSMVAGVGGMLAALPIVVSLRGALRVMRLKSPETQKRGF